MEDPAYSERACPTKGERTHKTKAFALRTSCLIWTARLLSTHCMHIHRHHRKLTTFGISTKTHLPASAVNQSLNSPLVAQENKCSFQRRAGFSLVTGCGSVGKGAWRGGQCLQTKCASVRCGPSSGGKPTHHPHNHHSVPPESQTEPWFDLHSQPARCVREAAAAPMSWVLPFKNII